jgi:serine-type D-Ala-D-Ala carboxypeptidase
MHRTTFVHMYRSILPYSYVYLLLLTMKQTLIVSAQFKHTECNGFDNALVDEFIEKEVQQGFPGAALIVTRYERIVKQSVYGYKLKYDENARIIDRPELLTPDTLFDLASLTKMFATNYALMQLVAQEKLNVNDPVVKYIPEYCGCNPDKQCRETRLIKDLLTHTAGYAPSVEFYNPAKVSIEFYSQDKHRTAQIIETELEFQRSRGEDQQPVYSDIDYMLLGLIVERIGGMPIDQYVNSYLYEPLGLTHTSYNPLSSMQYQKSDFAATELNGNTRNRTINFPNVRTQVLRGQVHDEKSFYSMNGLSGHAGLFSNLNDMAILSQLMLNNGIFGPIQLWNKDVQDRFLTPYALDSSYGLGWRLNRNKSLTWFGLHASEKAYGHTGWTGTCCVIDPEYSLTITLLTNKRHTPCIDGIFDGEKYETGKYGKIMTLVYEAMLLHKH